MFGELGKIMKLASEFKKKMPEVQARLASSRFEADAGGGAVKATVDGRMNLTDLKIDQQVLGDVSIDAASLEEMIKTAITVAQAKASQAAAEATKELTGGINLGDLGSMF